MLGFRAVIILRVVAMVFGLLLISLASLTYEDEENRLQNKVEDWWVQIDDKRTTSLSWATLFIQSSPTFITTEEAHKAAYENGFRVELGRQGGWIGYCSTTARGEVWIARDPLQDSWLLAITHPGVVSEISLSRAEIGNSPGRASYAFSKLSGLYDALDRAYKLGVSLPDAPLEVFRKLTADLPRSTETERLIVVRVGQDVFPRCAARILE